MLAYALFMMNSNERYQRYIETKFKVFKFENRSKLSILTNPNNIVTLATSTNEAPMYKRISLQQNCWWFVFCVTCLDITYSIRYVPKFMKLSKKTHRNNIKHIMKYI